MYHPSVHQSIFLSIHHNLSIYPLITIYLSLGLKPTVSSRTGTTSSQTSIMKVTYTSWWMDIWIDGWMSWLLSFDDDYPIIDDGMDDSMMDDGMSVVHCCCCCIRMSSSNNLSVNVYHHHNSKWWGTNYRWWGNRTRPSRIWRTTRCDSMPIRWS